MITEVKIVRTIAIEPDFPEDAIYLRKYDSDGSPYRESITLSDVEKIDKMELQNIEVDHPVRGLIRPWRQVVA